MKTLIITAHPSSTGHTHKIAEAYKAAREARGHTVTLENLYTTEYQLPFLSFEESKSWGDHHAREYYQKLVLDSDEIVFVHPIWWNAAPAIMKNWLDHVFQAHFAFKYEDGKPLGLLKGKHAKVFATAGGPSWLYALFFSPFKLTWEKAVNGFCGITPDTFLVCGNMAMPEAEANFEKFLEKVKASA
jgi:putative NADPH-quinone reductase